MIDLERIVREAVAAELAPLRSELAELRADVRRPTDPLLPLCEILHVTPGAARMREQRTPALLAVAIVDGRRRLYRTADVERVLGMRGRPDTSRASVDALTRARQAKRGGHGSAPRPLYAPETTEAKEPA